MPGQTTGCVLFADVSGTSKLSDTLGYAGARDREVVLRKEEARLRGHGFITLGQSRSTATEFVEFFCE